MRIKKPKDGFENLTKEKARIIAHLIGDGAHYQTKHDYVLKYEVKDQDSLDQFAKDIISVYGLVPSYEQNTSGITGKPITFVRLRSKIAYEDLLRYASFFSSDWTIESPLFQAPLAVKKAFLQALFDDEGSVRGEGVTLYSINKGGLEQIMILLNEFGIICKIRSGFGSRRNVFGLIIKDKHCFRSKIGFGLPRKREKLDAFIRTPFGDTPTTIQ
ncbi:hypothetical protein J4460_02400 [Candidatus Woesearchaeota archaeon]|nr:hypothetical protein [Candidatus Woesearchaeota archaeon]HIH38883.1 hypothetical protein [Candidatus Woesearchaeota archaeon]HIH48695.1 hypothetical protein [Candidatus Woesearchaeota archaeon]HIJ03789.1 hypothetical protein [Candidatus Woesearchaeota archaeon]